MPGYVEAALQRFYHTMPHRPEHAPHAWTKPTYGQPIQYTDPEDDTPALIAADLLTVQQICGTFLFYARALDNTMLPGLNTISSSQAAGTRATMLACTKLLNYAATHPNATIRYHKSGMILHIHSDASYLSAPKARSRAAGYFFLSDDPSVTPTPNNGPIHVLCSLLSMVVSSAAEAEVGAAFMNGQMGCPIRQTLIELGHPQPPTPIQTNNECAKGILNDTVKQKRSKAIDMRFYWLRDRINQGQYTLYWAPGKDNLADYHTKHHAPSHHIAVRRIYLHEPQSTRTMTPSSAHNPHHSMLQCTLCEGVLKSSLDAQLPSIPNSHIMPTGSSECHCAFQDLVHSSIGQTSEHMHD